MLAERGVDVSYETVRRWFLTCGPAIAANLRRMRPKPSNHCHLDEMVVTNSAKRYWLWRAVDNEGEVLDFLVQPRRIAKVARKPMIKLLTKCAAVPSQTVTDRRHSYATTFRSLGLSVMNDRGLRAVNRVENCHQPERRRERKQQSSKSPGSAQRFLAVHAATYNTFCHRRHLLSGANYKDLRTGSFETWASASAVV
jgi:putative transposase